MSVTLMAETNLYKDSAIADAVDDASKVATNYLAYNAQDGLTVGRTGQSERAVITSDGMEIYDGQNENIAEFKSVTRLGEAGKANLQLDYHSMQLQDMDGETYMYISDLRDASGYATITEERAVSSTEARTSDIKLFYSIEILSDILEVTKNGTAVSNYYISGLNTIHITSLSENDSLVIIYRTKDTVRAYTLGTRTTGRIGNHSFTSGIDLKAAGICSHAEGSDNVSIGLCAHAEGSANTANGDYSHVEGYNCVAKNMYCHSEGYGCETGQYRESRPQATYGYASHAEGYQCIANAHSSHAEGYGCKAYGNYSHAEGYMCTANEDMSEHSSPMVLNEAAHAEGCQCAATRQASHAEGNGCTASALYAHAGGNGSEATGEGTFSHGDQCTASGPYSIAMGSHSTASGTYSFAGGLRCVASSDRSVAIGNYCTASGYAGVAIGNGVQASQASQIAVGSYNTGTTSGDIKFVIGGGNSSTSKDIMTVDGSGNTIIAGTLTQSSDKRLKLHHAYLSDQEQDVNSFIESLKPAYFEKDQAKHLGFYAQDVQLSDKWNTMVSEDTNGYLALGYTEIIAPLVAYVQQQQKKIDSLEERIARLESLINQQ